MLFFFRSHKTKKKTKMKVVPLNTYYENSFERTNRSYFILFGFYLYKSNAIYNGLGRSIIEYNVEFYKKIK